MRIDRPIKDDPPAPTGRAVAVMKVEPAAASAARPAATFVAQLLACRQNVAAYRTARKNDPKTATAAYRQEAWRPYLARSLDLLDRRT